MTPHPHADADPRTFWEGHYAEHRERMRGNPNALATEHAADLPPGSALELGCGQGADAIRLAGLGWTVLAVDMADAALELGRARAADAGVAERITWRRHDLSDGVPEGSFDLVLASYLQSPVRFARVDVLRAAADRVAPGGMLLVIGHAGPPSWADPGAGAHVDMPSADELVAALDLPSAAWDVDVQADVEREVTDPDGRPGTRPDSVVRLRRRARWSRGAATPSSGRGAIGPTPDVARRSQAASGRATGQRRGHADGAQRIASKAARTSSTNASGCSSAAKCPPRSRRR